MISITDIASNQIDKLCKSSNKYVRLMITSGGCQGYNKIWELSDSIESDDIIFNCIDGKLIIDSMSLELLDNAKIDYNIDLAGSYFVISIPSATTTCGCGTSFSL